MELNAVSFCRDIKRNNFPISDELFDVDSEKAWACVKGEYFPEKHWKREDQITNLALVQLLYLASISNSPQKSPFTENEISILQKSNFWEIATKVSILVFAYGCNTLLFGIVPFLGLIPNVTNHSSTQQSYFSPLQLALIYATFGIIANVFSTWSTGTAPNESSNAFNAKQDALSGMEKTYADLAKRLILFYFNNSKKEAEKIASNINVDDLKNLISSKIQDKARGKRILERLRDAVDFINSQGTHFPKEDATFCLFIKGQENFGRDLSNSDSSSTDANLVAVKL